MDLLVGVDRAHGVGADDLDGRVLLLQVASRSGDRAAGADADDEVRELAVGLAPQLRPGRLVVGLRVGRVRVLVGLEGAGDLAREAVGDAVVGARRVGRDVGRRHHHLGPVRAQEVDLLLAHLVRHHRDHAVALEAGGDGEPGAGVAGGRLDDRAAGAQAAVALRGLDHPDRDAVLDRAAGVEDLELRHDLGLQAGADAGQPDERRVPDRVEDRLLDLGHGPEDKVAGVGEVGRVLGLWRYPVKSMAAGGALLGRGGLRRLHRRSALGVRARRRAAQRLPVDDDPGGRGDARARAAVRGAGAARQVAGDGADAGRLGARRHRSGAGGLAGRRGAGDQAGPGRVRRDAAVAHHDRGRSRSSASWSASSCTPSGSAPTCSSSPTSARTSGSGASSGSAGWRCGSTSATRAA